MASAGNGRQRIPADAIGLVDERTPVGHEAVEEVEGKRDLAGEPLDLVDPPESPHELLEGQGPARGVERHDLAVEDVGARRQLPPRRFDDVGQARGDVGQAARPDGESLAVTGALSAGGAFLTSAATQSYFR